jgi:hypothetical protein
VCFMLFAAWHLGMLTRLMNVIRLWRETGQTLSTCGFGANTGEYGISFKDPGGCACGQVCKLAPNHILGTQNFCLVSIV